MFRESTINPDSLFTLDRDEFSGQALAIFHFQYRNNSIYRTFVDTIGIRPEAVDDIKNIPFLPIQFFKSREIVSTSFEPQVIFESSGTTGEQTSRHLVRDTALYEKSFRRGFEKFYGEAGDWCILGLLPSYLERRNSSLVYMVDDLIRASGHPLSGFYLRDLDRLSHTIQELEKSGQKTLLIGVTFALLDFAEQFSFPLAHTILMETGGMKGRRKEMTRKEVHGILQKSFGNRSVHSEYGMTELLSQAYAKEAGVFEPVPWMRVLVRPDDDPLTVRQTGEGILNIIDLANIYSCSFIATDDTGKVFENGGFEVTGRVDYSDIRGCSLLVG
jgi:phenylacetate-coenzyme A ligase PaaK-like adenylate-forming protein